MDADESEAAMELVDFTHPVSTGRLNMDAHLSHGGVHVARGTLSPQEGGEIGAAQFSVVVHKGEPFDMEWRLPGSDCLQTRRIEYGDIHINPGDTPFFQRWRAHPQILGIALDHTLIDRVGNETFGRGSASLQTLIGVKDDCLKSAAKTWREELAAQGAGGKLIAEHMGVILSVHLFRHYSDAAWLPPPARGGLGVRRLRQVIDFIEAHLAEDLSLSTMAHVAGRSLHHFSKAFRQSTGTPPHRFVLIRRIERAKILLLATDAPIAQIALQVGFANQSHFGHMFRQVSGVTPLRFRLDRKA